MNVRHKAANIMYNSQAHTTNHNGTMAKTKPIDAPKVNRAYFH